MFRLNYFDIFKDRKISTARMAALFVIACCSLSSCGGGSSSPSSPSGAQPALPVTSSHPPFRTRYLRTDAQYGPSLQYFPPHFAKYDSVHNRFFISNYALNRVDVFDATSESEIGSVLIPAPWGIDVAPDGSKMYVATAF